MFQEAALFPWLNVLGNVMYGLKLKPNLSKAERREIAEAYLKMVDLEKFMHANIHELSGGMKQRVALARALAPDPKVLLMDEPFASLDAMTREQFYGDLQHIWETTHKTILLVTHNVREAVCLGDRVFLFSPRPGRIAEEFKIFLPRPRDINSVDLAEYATTITRTLKGVLQASQEVAELNAPQLSLGFLRVCSCCGKASSGRTSGRRYCCRRRCWSPVISLPPCWTGRSFRPFSSPCAACC